MFDIVSLGEGMVELRGEGPLGSCPTFDRSTGGDTLNVLVAAARLGGRTAFVTRLGNDPFHDFLAGRWKDLGVDLGWTASVDGFNAVYFISLRPDGERDFTYYRAGSAASHLSPQDIPDGIWKRTRYFFSSGITQALSETCRAAVRDAMQRARGAGVSTAFDVNYRPRLRPAERARAETEELLPFIDTLFVSLGEESEMLAGSCSARTVAETLRARGVGCVVVRDGAHGAVVASSQGLIDAPVLHVAVVDTTAAGDAFNGGFLYALSRGMDQAGAARVGTVVAGLKVTGRGAIDSLPDRLTVERALRKHFGLELP